MTQFDINTDVTNFGIRHKRSKWVCFSCRNSFSRTSTKEPVKCLLCGAESVDMGPLFEPPKKQSIKKWKIAELLSNHGYRYNHPGAVVHINYLITGNGKLTYKAIEKNILSRANKGK